MYNRDYYIDCEQGNCEGAQAKRIGGLEISALMAKGAYNFIRDAMTTRGAENNQYWSLVRQGYNPPEPGTPFVWDKFRALLNGAGMNAKDLGGGQLRLMPFTQRDIDKLNPIGIEERQAR